MFQWNWSSTLVSWPHAGTVGQCQGPHMCSAAPSPEHSQEFLLLCPLEGICWMEGGEAATFSNHPASLPAAPARFEGRCPTTCGRPVRLDHEDGHWTHFQQPGIPCPRLVPTLPEIPLCPGVGGYILQPWHKMQFDAMWTEDCGHEVLPAAHRWFWRISSPARVAHSNASGMAVMGRAQGLHVLGGLGGLPGDPTAAQNWAPPAHGARLKCSQACVRVLGGNFHSC